MPGAGKLTCTSQPDKKGLRCAEGVTPAGVGMVDIEALAELNA